MSIIRERRQLFKLYNTRFARATWPFITYKIQSSNNGVLLQRPFLTRTNTELSYRAQLLMAKPRLSHRDAIMGLMTNKTTTSRNQTVIPYISDRVQNCIPFVF